MDREVRPLTKVCFVGFHFVHASRKNRFFPGFLFLVLVLSGLFGSDRSLCAAQFKTTNFVVTASTPDLARRVAHCAEESRSRLSILWLGTPLPTWSSPCPIKVKSGPNLGAGGETTFTFAGNEIRGWKMSVQGTEERILDSVVPHEISHTILATYFGRPVPRWIDEGAATSIEADVERNNYRHMLIGFLQEHKGLPFNTMVRLTEYPADMMPFYSQGFSVCEYLIAVGGHRRLVEFARVGMATGNWSDAVHQFYGYKDLSDLQIHWTDWISEWHHNGHPDRLPQVAKVPDYRFDIYGREIDGTAVAADSSIGRSETVGVNNGLDHGEKEGRLIAAAMNGQSAPPFDSRSQREEPQILRPGNPLNSFVALPESDSLNGNGLPAPDLYDSFQNGVGTAAPAAGRLLTKTSPTPSAAKNLTSKNHASENREFRYQGSYGRRDEFTAPNEMARIAPPMTPPPFKPEPLRLGVEPTILGQTPQ